MLRIDLGVAPRLLRTPLPAQTCSWCQHRVPSWRLSASASAVSLEQDLLAWAKRRGVNVDKLIARPAADRDGNLQLQASRSCPKGETVFSIPKEVGLSACCILTCTIA